jgi:hypothetical protein
VDLLVGHQLELQSAPGGCILTTLGSTAYFRQGNKLLTWHDVVRDRLLTAGRKTCNCIRSRSTQLCRRVDLFHLYR